MTNIFDFIPRSPSGLILLQHSDKHLAAYKLTEIEEIVEDMVRRTKGGPLVPVYVYAELSTFERVNLDLDFWNQVRAHWIAGN